MAGSCKTAICGHRCIYDELDGPGLCKRGGHHLFLPPDCSGCPFLSAALPEMSAPGSLWRCLSEGPPANTSSCLLPSIFMLQSGAPGGKITS